jgi:hypothetical protein
LLSEPAARLRCYEAATAGPSKNAAPPNFGPKAGWRLVRTPGPAGRDVVAIIQTADTAKSDLNLAGLMLRCSETGPEVLVVLILPLPPRTHPRVVVSTGRDKADFSATTVPPGAAILLPKEAIILASGSWTAATELSVEVDAPEGAPETTSIKGVIPLAGLGAALSNLLASCSSP